MAELVIKKQYGSLYEYNTDLAKQTGVYDYNIASDPDSGYAYVNWLASKKLDDTFDMNTIKNVDTRLLNPTDAFTKLQLATGDITENEFKSYFKGDDYTFDDVYDSVDDYFKYQQQRSFNKLVYDNTSDVVKFLNGVGYTIGEILTAPLQMLEGIIDAGAYLVSGLGAWEAVGNWVKEDFTGAGKAKQDLAQFRRTSVDWDDNGGAWSFVGQAANEIGKLLTMYVTGGTSAITQGISKGLYYTSIAGQSAEDVIRRYGAGIDSWSKRNVDLGLNLAIEAATEAIFAGGATGVGKFSMWKSSTTTGRLLSSAVSEGIEEFIAEFLQPTISMAIEGKQDQIDLGETLKNAGIAAMIGAITGTVGESIRLSSIDPSKLTFIENGAKVSKAKAAAIIDTLQANRKNLDGMMNSQINQLKDKFNLSDNDIAAMNQRFNPENKEDFKTDDIDSSKEFEIESTDADGNTITKKITSSIIEDFKAASKADAETSGKVQNMIIALATLKAEIGDAAFKKGLDLWESTEANLLETAKNWYSFLNEMESGNSYLTPDVMEATEQFYAAYSNHDKNLAVTPIVTSKWSQRHWKVVGALNKLFGVKTMFVDYRNSETNTPVIDGHVGPITVLKSKNGQKYAFINEKAFDSNSIGDNISEFSKAILAQELGDNKAIKGDQIELYEVLTDPEKATEYFCADKKSSRAIIKSLKLKIKDSKNEKIKQSYEYLLWNLRKNIIKGFPKKAKFWVVKQLEDGLTDKDVELIINEERLKYYTDRVVQTEMLVKQAEDLNKLDSLESQLPNVLEDQKKINQIKGRIALLKSEYSKYQENVAKEIDLDEQITLAEEQAKQAAGNLMNGSLTNESAEELRNRINTLKQERRQLVYDNAKKAGEIQQLQEKLIPILKHVQRQSQLHSIMIERSIFKSKERIWSELVSKTMAKDDVVKYDELINEDTPNYDFHWGLITDDVVETRVKEYLVSKFLVDVGFNGRGKNLDDIGPSELINPDNYTKEFLQQLSTDHPGATFEQQLSLFLYDTYGAVIIPSGRIVIPINYMEHITDEASKILSGEDTIAYSDSLFSEEFLNKYPLLRKVLSQVLIMRVPSINDDPRYRGVYNSKNHRIYITDSANIHSIFHEVTHAVCDFLNITSGGNGVYNILLTDMSSDAAISLYQDLLDAGLVSPITDFTDVDESIKKKIFDFLYKFDFEEMLARGDWLSSSNKVINEVPLYDKVSVVFDTNGFHCTGKLSYIRYNASERAKTELTQKLLSRAVRFDKDVDNNSIIPKNIRSIDIGSNEDSWKTIDTKLEKVSDEIVEFKKQGLDVPRNAATGLFNNPNTRSNKTSDMYGELKTTILGLKTKDSSNKFLDALRNSTEFSDEFKELFMKAVELNEVFLNVSITSEDLKNKAISMFSNEKVLEKLTDVEVQFLLKWCFNCEDLQIKTAEDLKYWINEGFATIATIVSDDELSKKVDWENINTVEDLRKAYKKDSETIKDLQKLYDEDPEYKKLSIRLEWLKTALDEVKNSSKSKPSEILEELSDNNVRFPKAYKNIKFKNKKELVSELNKDIKQYETDINTKLNQLDKDLANKSGFLDISKTLDVLTNINATGTRNVIPIILGNSKNSVSINEDTIKNIMKSMRTTLSFKSNNNTVKTKKGETLNAIENISDNKEIEDYSNNDEPTQMVGAAQLYKKVDNFYNQQNLSDNYDLQIGLTEDERSVVEKAIESKKPWLVSDENNTLMIQSEFLPNMSNLGVDTLELLITAAYVGVKAGNINKRNLTNYLQNVFKQIFNTKTLTENFISSIDLVVNKVVDFDSDIFKKAQAKIDEYLEFDDEAELVFKLNRKYSKQLQKGDIKYNLFTPQGRAAANKQLAEKAKQKQLDKPKRVAQIAETVKKAISEKNAVASLSENIKVIKENVTKVETEIDGGLESSETAYTVPEEKITPEKATQMQEVVKKFEEDSTTDETEIIKNVVKSVIDEIEKTYNDDTLKSNFLDWHEYDGTVDAFKKQHAYFINQNSKTINNIFNLLDDKRKNPNVSSSMFMEILDALFKELEHFEYFKNVPKISGPGVNNRIIYETIIDLIYSRYLPDISLGKIAGDSTAKTLIDYGAKKAILSGKTLRHGLFISVNQFKIDDDSVDMWAKSFTAMSTEEFKKIIDDLRQRLSDLAKEYAENTKKYDEKKQQYKQTKQDTEKLKKEYEEKLKNLRKNLEKMRNNKNASKNDIKDLEKQEEDLEQNIDKLNKKLNTVQKQLERENKEYQNTISKYRRVLEFENLLKSKNPEDQAKGMAIAIQYQNHENMPEEIKEALKKSGVLEKAKDAYAKYLAKTGSTSKARLFYDRLMRARYIAMLSSPSTWTRNVIVNAISKSMERLTEALSSTEAIANLATKKLNFDKLNYDEFKQTVAYEDEDGEIQTYKLPIPNFDYKNINNPDYVVEWIKSKIFTNDELNKIFGFGGKYGEYKQHRDENAELLSHPETWFDKFLDKVGIFEEYILTATDAKVTHPMAQRVFGQLVLSNLDYIQTAILTKIAVLKKMKITDKAFKDTEEYANITKLINNLKNNIGNQADTFKELTELIPKEIIERLKNVAIVWTKKTYYKNDNALGKLLRDLNEKHPLLALPLDILSPFIRMSTNVMMTMIDYSPFGFISWINKRNTYKKLQNALVANVEMLDTDVADDIVKYKQDLLTMYTKITGDSNISKNGLESTVNSMLKRYNEDPKNPGLTKEQYDILKDSYDLLNSAKGRKNLLEKEISKISNSFSGTERIDIIRQFSKGLIGTAMYAIGAILKALGILDIDKDEDYMGVVLDIAGWKIRLSDFSPMSSALILGAATTGAIESFAGVSHKRGELGIDTLITMFLNDTPLDFLADAIEYSDNVSEWFANIASNLLVQFVPNVIKQLGKPFSQNKKVKSSDSLTRILQNVADSIPFFRDVVLEDKIDPYTGEPVKRADLTPIALGITELIYGFTGVKIVYRSDSRVEQETRNLGVETVGATGRFTYKNQEIRLSGSELTEFKKHRGNYINEKLNKLINTQTYKNASSVKKQDLIKAVYTKASEYAKRQWIKNKK